MIGGEQDSVKRNSKVMRVDKVVFGIGSVMVAGMIVSILVNNISFGVTDVFISALGGLVIGISIYYEDSK